MSVCREGPVVQCASHRDGLDMRAIVGLVLAHLAEGDCQWIRPAGGGGKGSHRRPKNYALDPDSSM